MNRWLVHEWGNKYQVVEAKVVVTKKPGFMSAGQKILAFEIKSKADAQLMAAAPAMYEALKAYQKANRIHNDSESILYTMADKALAQAEGKVK